MELSEMCCLPSLNQHDSDKGENPTQLTKLQAVILRLDALDSKQLHMHILMDY